MRLKQAVYLAVSLLLTAGIALAQQPSTPTPAPLAEPFGSFSMLVDGGGFLGVYAEDVSNDNMSQYGLRDAHGVAITEVVKDSPAEKAGLRKGDVILRFDNESVTSVRKLNRLVSEVAPDQSVALRISRGGSEQDVSVVIGKRKNYSDTFQGLMNSTPNTWKWEFPEGNKDDGLIFALGNSRRLGVSTMSLTRQLADYFGVADGKGVLVTSVERDSAAAKAGLKAGDVITAIDGEKIEASGDLARAINKQKDAEVTLTIIRDKSQRTIRVTPEKRDAPVLPRGRSTADRRIIRDEIRDSILSSITPVRIVMPRIELPAIPEINVVTPRIELPTIPEVNVVIPRMPRVKVIRVPRQPI